MNGFEDKNIYNKNPNESLKKPGDSQFLETHQKLREVLNKIKHLEGIELAEKDIEYINSTINYIENWFYDRNWTNIPKSLEKNPDSYMYFSVPATILNLITKIKEIPKHANKIIEFNPEKIKELRLQVRNFEDNFLSEQRLNSLLKEKSTTNEEIEAINTILQNIPEIKNTFVESLRSVQKEFDGRGSGSKAPDIYFIKTCLIAAEVLRREKVEGPNHVFIPDIEIPQRVNDRDKDYIRFDFSDGKDNKKTSMHYHRYRLPYCKFVVQYLKS